MHDLRDMHDLMDRGTAPISLAADPAADPTGGNALIVLKDELDPRFRLAGSGPGNDSLDGRTQSAYIPWFWFPIMKIIRALPTRIFNTTKL